MDGWGGVGRTGWVDGWMGGEGACYPVQPRRSLNMLGRAQGPRLHAPRAVAAARPEACDVLPHVVREVDRLHHGDGAATERQRSGGRRRALVADLIWAETAPER